MDTRSILSAQESLYNSSFLSFVSFYESAEDITKPLKAYHPHSYPKSFFNVDTVEQIENTTTIDYKELFSTVNIMSIRDVDAWIQKMNKNMQQPHKAQSLTTLFGCALLYFVLFGMMNGCLGILLPLFSTIYGENEANIIILPFLILSFLLIPATTWIFKKLNVDTYLAVSLGSCVFTIGMSILSLWTYDYYANIASMVIMGIGTSMMILPTTRTLNTWFDRHICLAQSMLWVGAGMGSLIVPHTFHYFVFAFNLKVGFSYLVVLSSSIFFIASFCCVDNYDYLLKESLIERKNELTCDEDQPSCLIEIKQISFILIIITTLVLENATSFVRLNNEITFLSYGLQYNMMDDYYAAMNFANIFGAIVFGILTDIGINTNFLQGIVLIAVGIVTILMWVPGFEGESLKLIIAVIIQGFLFSGICTLNSISVNLKVKTSQFDKKFSFLYMVQSFGCLPVFKVLEMQSGKGNKYLFICLSAILVTASLLSFATYAFEIVENNKEEAKKEEIIDLYSS